MAPVTATLEIDRRADEVFAYVIDPSRYMEWQKGAVRGGTQPKEEGGPIGVGSICSITRRVGGRERTTTSEVTEYNPPRRWALHGLDGTIRADVQVDVEPVSPTKSRVTIEIEFFGQGLGRLLVPMVISQARREMAQSMRALKERTESKTALA